VLEAATMIRQTIRNHGGIDAGGEARIGFGCSIELHSLCSFDKEWSHGSGRRGWCRPNRSPVDFGAFDLTRPTLIAGARPRTATALPQCDAQGKAGGVD
jgi:hypothetical protein